MLQQSITLVLRHVSVLHNNLISLLTVIVRLVRLPIFGTVRHRNVYPVPATSNTMLRWGDAYAQNQSQIFPLITHVLAAQLMPIGTHLIENASFAQLIRHSIKLAHLVYAHQQNHSLPRIPAVWPAHRLITGTLRQKYASSARKITTTIISLSNAKFAYRGSYMTPNYSNATAPTISHISISQAIASTALLQLFGTKPPKSAFHVRALWSTMPGSATVHALTALPWPLMVSVKNVQAMLLYGMERIV